MKKMMMIMLLLLLSEMTPATAWRLVYVPHDSRPISAEGTASVLSAAGCEVLVPPTERLGRRDRACDEEWLYEWLYEKSKGADGIIISTDTLIYGSLTNSRKHALTEEELTERLARLKEYLKASKKARIYAFGSIMRTPRRGSEEGLEPEYYRAYGADIFRYTALIDKAESVELTEREKKEQVFLKELIPKAVLTDWMERRKKNYEVNKELIKMARDGEMMYLILGRDDNAPYSQTHMESRYLNEEGAGASRFQTLSGIDEAGLILLTRAANELERNQPRVMVKYNWGKGGSTVPLYSDEEMMLTVRDELRASGAMAVTDAARADGILMINTNPNGETLDGTLPTNDGVMREGTKYMAEQIEEYVEGGYAVSVADVAYANGSDNALMKELRERGLLYRLKGYGGWNTATNSMGYALAMLEMSGRMSERALDDLLTARYLDDWLYQGNVRGIVGRQLQWLRGRGYYGELGEKRAEVEKRCERLLTALADRELPPMAGEIELSLPWDRMFEADIDWE